MRRKMIVFMKMKIFCVVWVTVWNGKGTIYTRQKWIFPLKSNSHLPFFFLFTSMIALKRMMKNAFYFISSSFRSQDILTFVLTFWSCRKNGLIRKIRLISKFRRHGLVNKQLQYTCCSISHELKVTKQWNLVS